ncbi:hypothetical protein [Iodobacter fluviatilis]|uniref:Uncharacterized protein n=1 Tax=Iodobacter fluviatilis TaxID=537 RepID=A0A7G3GF70_9NEIS|nr:hypothetical protein [Iodobacter fluviatilis]QBC45868.1 hypothetical protein C1H71_20205 [Iodobacter fluviatilis]
MSNELVFSERAKKRLRIVSKFFKPLKIEFKAARDEFYPAVVEKVKALDEETREALRGLTDWVEEYEREEAECYPTEKKKNAEAKNAK